MKEELQRRARDENGKTIYVDSKMKYKEWKEKYVTNSSSDGIINKNTVQKEDEMKYTDITNKYTTEKTYQIKKQKYFIVDNGTQYNVDGRHVILKPTKKELEVAKLLGKTLGGKINIIPRINEPEGIKTPDYIINGEKFDLKEIKGNSKNSLYNALGKQRRQADNFIFDISDTQINEEEAVRQIKSIYNSNHRKWVHVLILIENNKILKIYKRG